MARAPMPYNADEDPQTQTEGQDPTLNPDKANANNNGSSTPPAPKPYQPPQAETATAQTSEPVAQRPTFATLQANGEARPPMPMNEQTDVGGQYQALSIPTAQKPGVQASPAMGDGNVYLQGLGNVSGAPSTSGPSAYVPPAPVQTLSGDWQAPTASAASAPLIASAAGGTMTPQGDAGNAFRGYQSADGGVFGQADTGDRSQALRALESISGIDSGSTYSNGVYGGGDPTKFGLGANATSADVTALSKLNGLVANGDPAGIQQALASGNPWLVANAQRELAKHPELSAPGATGRLAGNSTAADPAEQARLLAGQADGSVPSGPSAYAPPPSAPAGVPAAPSAPTAPPVAPPTATGGQTGSPVPPTANVPATSTPGASPATAPQSPQDILSMLMGGAQAPGKYGTDQVKNSYDWLGGQIDDQFNVDKQKLGEEMARRGLGASTIYGGRLNDLNIGKRTAKESLAYDLGDKVANNGAADNNSRLDYIRNLMGYGQQGFENDMSTAKFNADQGNQWQDFLMKMLGAGYGTSGA